MLSFHLRRNILRNNKVFFNNHRVKLASNPAKMSTQREDDAESTQREDNQKSITELLPDLPKGPLTSYRDQATFDWRKLKLEIEGEDCIRFKDDVWSFIRRHEIFSKSNETLPLDEARKIAQRRMRVFNAGNFMTDLEIATNPRLPGAFADSVLMYDLDMGVKHGLNYRMFSNVIQGLGSARHHKFIEGVQASKISGCFALTEFAHGSNAKGMQTTATHDVQNKQFILHCASFEAAKCWVGNLGKCATHAIVYAKLITSDGEEHGLHAFVVPIRCPETLKPYPGVVVGDLGEKIALNGVDNGFVMFNSYRIPAENLLNRLGDVNKDGKYVTPIKDPNKRFGASLGALSGGRVQIGIMASNQLLKAITVAVRYSAVRKQFGPEDSDKEFPVIEYQQQQFRLFPYLAVTYATKVFGSWLSEIHTTFSVEAFLDPKNVSPLKAMEIHAISSSSKPTVAWTARDGIQVCREACGGHGYLKAAGIGDWRNENDANCTYEGENSILVQQTSNWLLGLWRKIGKGEKIVTPYGSAEFLNYHEKLPKCVRIKSIKEAVDPEVSLSGYKWLICHYLKLTSAKIEGLSKVNNDNFTIRNNTQSHHAATLSVVFAEHAILNVFHEFVKKIPDQNCKNVLMKLVSLYGAWNIERHLGTLYMGNFLSEDAGQYIRDGIIELCANIKPEAVALIDTIAPPDFILNSVLGNSDGNVYQNLQSSIFSTPGALTRPDWWKEAISWKTYMPSKL